MRKSAMVAVAVMAIAAMYGLGGVANAKQRWPIIGCDQLPVSFENHYAWKYAPTGYCETSGALGTTTGISDAHWKHWGARQATATGMLVDGLGFEYPAKITAYDLHTTHNFLGDGTYAAWYNKLHVISRREYRGGIYRGPYNVFLNVTPWE